MSADAQTFGFSAEVWERAKKEAIKAIVRAGRKGSRVLEECKHHLLAE